MNNENELDKFLEEHAELFDKIAQLEDLEKNMPNICKLETEKFRQEIKAVPIKWSLLQIPDTHKIFRRANFYVEWRGVDENGRDRYALTTDLSVYNIEYKCFTWEPRPSARNELFFKHHRFYDYTKAMGYLSEFLENNPEYLWTGTQKSIDLPNYSYDNDED